MGKLRVLILLPLVVCFSLATVHAQTSLQLGTPIERTLGPGQVHEFTVNLEENSFIQLVVEQRGIDLFVKVSSPSGKNLGEYDTPNGADGPENVSFVASTAGTYRITISPLGTTDQTTGRYEIKVLELRKATDDELKAKKNLEEAKTKGIALLAEIESTLPQIKSPHNRIQGQLKAAELLWEINEKRAAKLMTDAIAGIKEFMADLDLDGEEYLMQYHAIAQLRQEVIRLLAERDPDAALSFLQSTTSRYSPYNSSRELLTEESTLELSIASHVSQKDPNKAAQIVRRNLKQAYSYNLIPTAAQIAQKNPELAKELGHEIAGKLLSEERLIKNVDAANLAMMLLRTYTAPEVQVVAKDTATPSQPSLLSEEEYKQLMQKALDEVLSYTRRGINQSSDAIWNLIPGLQSMGDQMERAINGSKAALDKKFAEISGGNDTIVNSMQAIQNAMNSNTAEAALETIEKAPADYREQLYVQLANREAANGDAARARQIINDHIANPYQRRQALASIEQQ
ncbi:MAG TPA: PPC domain-containing protein, partial [Pyrinomonadaceae bacterium]